MILEIDLGKKAFWLSLLVSWFVLNMIFLIILCGAEKHKNYDWGDALGGFIVLLCIYGWWVTE